MLTPKEVEGLTAILQLLSPENLLAVAKTTTNNMIKFESNDEAMRAIIAYTEKPSDLLRRQKIRKHIIFNYLRSTGTVVSVSAEKRDCVLACLRLWQSQNSIEAGDALDDKEESCERNGLTVSQQTSVNCIQECQNVCAVLDHETVGKLATQFLVWFFNSLNKLNDFGSHHFWPDCKFYMVMKTPPSVVREQCLQNADCVAQAFCDFILRDKLYFNPNMSREAVKYEQERHGLVKIGVGGVVHKNNNCIGLFDFFFGLIQDPTFNNNWKIKIVRLESQVAANSCVMPNSSVCASMNSLPMLA